MPAIGSPVDRGLLHEPLVHFLAIGVVLFAGYSLLRRGDVEDASAKEIRLTLDDLAQLEMLFEAQWRRPPTAEEFQALVENRVQEDILYREALALGLDQEDAIVKRRMAQKMRFLAEDMAEAREPTDAELRSWFEEHGDEFAQASRVSFRHLYFSIDERRGQARDDAAEALASLAGEPRDSELAATLADPFMFRGYYGERTSQEIGREFGPEFAQAVVALAPGSWQGPVRSGYGWHLVFVDSVTPGRVPSLEEIEQDVRSAWLAEQKAEAWRTSYAEMRAGYTVLLPEPPDASERAAPQRAGSAVAGEKAGVD